MPKAAQPKYGRPFDPWNSVALGHQRAETRGPGGWRENRTWKLHSQLRAGNTGGQRLSDTVGAGAEQHYRHQGDDAPPPPVVKNTVMDMLRKPGSMHKDDSRRARLDPLPPAPPAPPAEPDSNDKPPLPAASSSKLFDGLVIYVNGSTHPLISDHKLKHVLVENGARMSIHLGRRQVTHVILGQPSAPRAGGAGGGLAGGKLDREIRRVGGCGVKYVGVEW